MQRVSLHKGTPKTANRKITPFEAHLQEKMQFTAYLRGSVSIQDHKGPKVKRPKRVPKDPSVFVKCQKCWVKTKTTRRRMARERRGAGLLLLVWRHHIRNNILKMCYRQSRRGVLRQNSRSATQ